jgi:hypothetical protein
MSILCVLFTIFRSKTCFDSIWSKFDRQCNSLQFWVQKITKNTKKNVRNLIYLKFPQNFLPNINNFKGVSIIKPGVSKYI